MNIRTIALVATAALAAGCANHAATTQMLPDTSSARAGVTQPSAAAKAARGSIVSLKKWGAITAAQMSAGLFGEVINGIGGKPKCNVTLYAIVYNTVGVKGEAATASTAFMVPGSNCGVGPFPLVGYAHGTNLAKEQLITDPSTTSTSWTAPDQSPVVVAAIYAAHGYAVAATDYLGLGLSNYPFHPYLHVNSEATAVIDSLRAVRLAAAKLGIRLQKGTGVYLSGHSQGGQVTVGTQRAIESGAYKGEFSVISSNPSSGPYALTHTFQDSLRKQSQDAPILAAYILTGYQKIYGNLYTDPTAIFKNPYAKGIDTLLPVATYKIEAELEGKTLPLQLPKLIQPAFKKSFLNDATSPARVATADNDLLQGWKPKAQINLCGGSRDPEVEFQNAILADNYFTKTKSQVTITDVNSLIPSSVPMVDYHVTVALFSLTLQRVEFWDPISGAARSAR